MGIDAQMLVKVKNKKLTTKEIKTLSYNLAGSFYKESFWKFPCLEETKEFYQNCNSIIPAEDEQFLKVNLSARFYGEEYERGPIHDFIAIAEWLEYNIPNCLVFYGGDSSGVTQFNEAERQKLKEHFYKVGHLPYLVYFGDENKTKSPICSCCDQLLISNGGGGDKIFWFCYGCKQKAITYRDGKVLKAWDTGENLFEMSRKIDEESKI